MTSSRSKIYQVAVILFPGADLLDFASPVAILSHINYNSNSKSPNASFSPAFKIHHIAQSLRAIPVGESQTSITPDMTFEEAHANIDTFDILVIPGGPVGLIQSMATSDVDGPEKRFVRQFSCPTTTTATTTDTTSTSPHQQPQKDKPGEERKERIAFSICDGSLFLAAVGALSNLKATSHHLMLKTLKKLDGSIEVIDSTADGRARRYVYGGRNQAGVRIVTAGGVTCGLDAGLYVVEMMVGRGLAERWAEMNEYEWKRARVD